MSKKAFGSIFAATLAILAAGCTANPAGTVVNNPFGVPSDIGIALPRSTASGAAAYRVSADAPSIAQAIKDNVNVYRGSAALINMILGNVSKAHLIPGHSYTFDDPNNPMGKLTVLLTVLSDHAVISIGRGTSATGPDQVMGIAYTSPRKGHAVFHIKNDATMGNFYLAEDYDVDAGRASADGVQDGTMLPANGKKFAAHWEFTRHDDPAASESFTMQVAANAVDRGATSSSGQLALTANFLADGSAAAILGLQNAGTNNTFVLIPSDGVSYADPSAPRDFYMNAQGQDLPRTAASAQLKGIVPANSAIYRPVPADPSQGDPFADARYAFPSATEQASASL